MIKVAIVIPIYKNDPNSDDLISLRHLQKYLGKYDRYFVAPENINAKKYKQKDIKIIKYDRKFFLSTKSYNQLLLQQDFYEKFSKYEFILIYQLDALVFSDELINWCRQDYDYIAAPWFNSIIGRLSHMKGHPSTGGNGGFSLRRVQSALKVLEEVSKDVKRRTEHSFVKKLRFLTSVLLGKSHGCWLKAPADNYPFNEDGFWSLEAPKYLKKYRVANAQEAIKFSFEKQPQECFKKNNYKLPFGAHGWKKYGQKFWEPYLLKR